jgi:very-short-patch-repair endonuclease
MMSTAMIDRLRAVCTALHLTPAESPVPSPWHAVAATPEQQDIGIHVTEVPNELSRVLILALETAGQAASLSQGMILVADIPDETQVERLGLDTCAIPMRLVSFDEIQALSRQRNRTTVLGSNPSEGLEGALREVRSRILNLTASNVLISLKETRLTLRLDGRSPAQVLGELVSRGQPLHLVAQDQSGEKPRAGHRLVARMNQEALETKLRGIEREYRDRIEGRGLNELYLALGALQWYESETSDRMREAPLLLVPVRIIRERVTRMEPILVGDPDYTRPGRTREIVAYEYTLTDSEDGVRGNPTLLLKMQQDFALPLPELASYQSGDDDGGDFDCDRYLEAIAATVRNQPTCARWKVAPSVMLGFFSYTKAVMEEDLKLSKWPNGIPGQSLLQAALLGGEERAPCEIDDAAVEAAQGTPELVTIDDCDSSQARAIMLADQGRDLVIQGPPGTGKSQTITNLIAQALARGKRVLFLSEKNTALEVVRTRLDKRGLGDFLLPLHDTKLGTHSLHAAVSRRLAFRGQDRGNFRPAVAQVAGLAGHLSTWAKVMRRRLAFPNMSVGEVLWTTSKLRTEVEALRQDPACALHPLIQALQLPAPPDQAQVELASELFDDFARHEATGLLQRCDCWSGFLVRGRSPADLDRAGETLATLLRELDCLKAVVAGYEQLGWAGAGWSVDSLSSLVVAVAKLPDAPGAPREELATLLRILGGITGDEALPRATLSRLGHERDVRAKITAVLRCVPPDGWCDQAKAAIDQVDDGAFSGTAEIVAIHDLSLRAEPEVAAIRQALTQAQATARDLGLPGPERASEWFRLTKILEHLRSADEQTLLDLDVCHALSGFQIAAEAVEREVGRLRSQRQVFDGLFVWEDIPADTELARLRVILKEGHGTFRAWLPWSDYRKAQRICRGFLCSPARFKAAFGAILNGLRDIPRQRQSSAALAANTEYAKALGKVFAGMETDLGRLARVRALVQQLAKLCALADLPKLIGAVPGFSADRLRLERLTSAVTDGLSQFRLLISSVDAVLPATRRESDDDVAPRLDGVLVMARQASAITPFTSLPGLPDQATWDACRQASRKRFELQNLVQELHESVRALGLPDGHPDPGGCITEALAWHQHLADLPADVRTWILSSDLPHAAGVVRAREMGATLSPWLDRIYALTATLAGLNQDRAPWPRTTLEFARLRETVADCVAKTPDLPGWARIVELNRRAGEGTALRRLATGMLGQHAQLPVAVAKKAWEWARYESIAAHLIAEDPQIANFDRTRHENRRKKFSQEDRELTSHAASHLTASLAQARPPGGCSSGKVGAFTEMGLIQHELGKKTRHVPVRDLVRRSGRALQSLMPCWMMSPLSVSWFLPRDGFAFDLVVMDEASQIRPEDAMGALMRAKQAIVVGDSKQMPPSRTFDSGSSLEGLFAISSMESILSLAEGSRRFMSTRLRWHYRSRHQDLIAFSNARYYDNDLLIFPSTHRTGSELGLHRIHLADATYEGHQNQTEAQRVVELIIQCGKKNLATSPERRMSLGVAAMNAPQRDLIEEILETTCNRDAAARKAVDALMRMSDPLFIQNLENVQGDERDHIVISFTYGPEPASRRVMQRFGPILQTGGERRLNVLFTRARLRLTAVTSMTSDQITAGPGSARGLRDLKAYLAFLETGKTPDLGVLTQKSGTHDSAFEAEVASVLSSLGLHWESQVGVAGYFIDLGVYHPEKPAEFLLGIECDGATYHSSVVARDRDRIREEVIRSRGWDIYRIWSTDWFQNRGLETDRLRRYLTARVGS